MTAAAIVKVRGQTVTHETDTLNADASHADSTTNNDPPPSRKSRTLPGSGANNSNRKSNILQLPANTASKSMNQFRKSR